MGAFYLVTFINRIPRALMLSNKQVRLANLYRTRLYVQKNYPVKCNFISAFSKRSFRISDQRYSNTFNRKQPVIDN